ncbi:hypothetical protein [Candidatus Uabimicrobium sp. HlEnr_7]|uniref:hypothetical protein n=1 Tax=Candidatus Uabimicrobium helgolandensis TaxID=3095367 RepID=UPI003557C56A
MIIFGLFFLFSFFLSLIFASWYTATQITISLFLGYVCAVIADYMIHRYIWHGKWRFVRSKFFQWWLYPHYVHHLIAHHKHAWDARSELTSTGIVPQEFKQTMEKRFSDQPWVIRALKCSNHGLSIANISCMINYYSLFVLTPHPYICLVIYFLWGYPAIFAILPSFLAIFTQINHRYYHMDVQSRREICPWYLRYFFCSSEFDRLAQAHCNHHYTKEHYDDFYSVYPFSRLFLVPIFGRS